MTDSVFAPSFENLPAEIVVFPLAETLLLPDGRMPLNIFEPRYIAMTDDAIASPTRLIGLIQPVNPPPKNDAEAPENSGATSPSADLSPSRNPAEKLLIGGKISIGGENPSAKSEPPLRAAGCAGRIMSFAETEDGRYLITLTGICRFRVGEEIAGKRGYRRVRADWSPYRADMESNKADAGWDRKLLTKNLRAYLERKGLAADWDAIRKADNAELLTSLAMLCPFSADEKQALLEADDSNRRAEIINTLMEMAVMENADGGITAH